MIDPIQFFILEMLKQALRHGLSRLKIIAERLFYDHAQPRRRRGRRAVRRRR